MNCTILRLSLCLLFALVTATGAWTQDVNTITTEAELIAWHESSNIPRGDMEMNGDVHFSDFLTFVKNLDRRDPSLTYLDGDLNLDGAVDFGDIAIFTNNFEVQGYQPEPEDRPASASLGLHVDIDSKIIISSATPVDILAIELRSPSGGLISYDPFPGLGILFHPEPFTSGITLPTSERINWSNLAPVSIDGDILTRVTATSDDISLHWIESGSYAVFSQSLGMGDAITGQPIFEIDLSLVDVDNSGDIGFADFLILSGNFGRMVERGTDGDIDHDGTVAFSDFLILSREFGNVLPTPAATSVPEADGSGKLLIAIGCYVLRRRQRSTV